MLGERFLLAVAATMMVAPVAAGLDGAMDHIYEQQFATLHLNHFKDAAPIGVDAAGKLVPTVLKYGHIFHRGKSTNAHYNDIYDWLTNLVSFGVGLYLVFDGFARYAPKAAKHSERQAREQKAKELAATMDLAAPNGSEEADKQWQRVVDRSALDLVHFTMQLCTDVLHVLWIVAPYEADQQLAFMARRGLVSAVLAPHNDSDLPAYGAGCVLYKVLKSGDAKAVRIGDILGKAPSAPSCGRKPCGMRMQAGAHPLTTHLRPTERACSRA